MKKMKNNLSTHLPNKTYNLEEKKILKESKKKCTRTILILCIEKCHRQLYLNHQVPPSPHFINDQHIGINPVQLPLCLFTPPSILL
jgi:hypothetical protein